ncbi:hypothetical protein PQG02_07830 [Nostoc sp. UHCC 0926]|nr:hypothetical protein [Nostoc sp. UHCC 0926]WDD34234.1 hypothetical protein PQG02_07830 [Nostoc sp. UHCC 0926]
MFAVISFYTVAPQHPVTFNPQFGVLLPSLRSLNIPSEMFVGVA